MMDDDSNYEASDDLHQNDTVRFSLTLCSTVVRSDSQTF